MTEGAKAVCAKHEQAYAVADGCPYCEVVADPDAFAVKLVCDGNRAVVGTWWPTTPQHVSSDDSD